MPSTDVQDSHVIHRSAVLRVFGIGSSNHGTSVITTVITFHVRSGWQDARPAQHQTRNMLVHRDSILAHVHEMLVLVCGMLANDSRQRRDARHAIRAATTVGCNRLARIDMNNRGMRKARTVQSGFKELPIAMG